MTELKNKSKVLNITLWIAQVLIALTFAWAAYMKLFSPVDKLAAMWPWTGQVSPLLVKGTGIIDLLGALGLILPGLLGVQPKLTGITAICIVVLMVVASAFHISRGEASLIGFNIFVTVFAAFIAWGRLKRD